MTTTVETRTLVPVAQRSYTLIAPPTTLPKGKQRQIVLSVLSSAPGPWTIASVASVWESSYRHVNVPVDGILNSVRYHLHHLHLLSMVTYK